MSTWMLGTSVEIEVTQDGRGWYWRYHPAWVGAGVIANQERTDDAPYHQGPWPTERHGSEIAAVMAALGYRGSSVASETPMPGRVVTA